MASITLTIPDAQIGRVTTAFSSLFGYDPASGLTQGQFTKQQVSIWVKSQVAIYEEQQRLVQMQNAVAPVTAVDVS